MGIFKNYFKKKNNYLKTYFLHNVLFFTNQLLDISAGIQMGWIPDDPSWGSDPNVEKHYSRHTVGQKDKIAEHQYTSI